MRVPLEGPRTYLQLLRAVHRVAYHFNVMYSNYYLYILDVRKIGHHNIKAKMLDIEARVLIGWYSLASQSERMPTRCFYVKVVYFSYGVYIVLCKFHFQYEHMIFPIQTQHYNLNIITSIKVYATAGLTGR